MYFEDKDGTFLEDPFSFLSKFLFIEIQNLQWEREEKGEEDEEDEEEEEC